MAPTTTQPVRLLALFIGALLAGGCDGTLTDPDTPPDSTDPGAPDDPVSPPVDPFEPVPADTYVRKVKTLMTGEAPTEAELSAVRADPAALRGLVDGWYDTDVFRAKRREFFMLAFQQKNFDERGFAELYGVNKIRARAVRGEPVSALDRALDNVRESFARTVESLVDDGRPFTEAFTTRRFLMTTAMMYMLAYNDERAVNDERQAEHRRLGRGGPGFDFDAVTAVANGAAIPLGETVDPNSPNFMRYSISGVDGCNGDVLLGNANEADRRLGHRMIQLMFGYLRAGGCSPGRPTSQFFDDADFADWRWVTVRAPAGAEATTAFYDVPAMRGSDELILHTPRVGFFSTMAFFAGWNTNADNSHRVTANQALIVALGRSFDGEDNIVPLSDTSLDAEHADPTTPCFACHQALDPMRQVFRNEFNYFGREQTDPTMRGTRGVFASDGVNREIAGIDDYARTLAEHPRLPKAWVHKLCYYANSVACSDDDPEVERVASAFAASGFDFEALVVEFFSSPLATHATATDSAETHGTGVGIARRRHLCASLDRRLGRAGVCDGVGFTDGDQIRLIAATLPTDSYVRGSEAPLTISDSSLFYSSAVQNLCLRMAPDLVDQSGGLYRTADVDAALDHMVHQVMALAPGDVNAGPARAILADHYAEAVQAGESSADALASAFVIACSSATATSIGI